MSGKQRLLAAVLFCVAVVLVISAIIVPIVTQEYGTKNNFIGTKPSITTDVPTEIPSSVATNAPTEIPSSPASTASSVIETFVKSALSCKPSIPGLSLAVVEMGSTVLAQGYGLANIARNLEATEQTRFNIGSMASTFSTALLARIQETISNNTNFDTKLVDILGKKFKFSSKDRTDYSTIMDLATHRLGILDYDFLRYQSSMDRQELSSIVKSLPSIGEMRESFQYNGLMYGLLAYITEVIHDPSTATAWEDLLIDDLLVPIGMLNTTVQNRITSDEDNVAKPYMVNYDGKLQLISHNFSRHWTKLGGSAGIVSTALDMAKWMNFHLDAGQVNNLTVRVNLLEAVTVQLLHTAAVIANADINIYSEAPQVPHTYAYTGYAAGWMTGHYRGLPMIGYQGNDWESTSLLTLLPKQNIGVYTAFNSPDKDHFFSTAIHLYIIDAMLGEDPWINASSACTFPEPWNMAPLVTPEVPFRTDITAGRALRNYTGTYSDAAFGTILIELNNATNYLQMLFGFGTWDLFPTNTTDTFSAQGRNDVWFSRFDQMQFQYDESKMTITTFKPISFYPTNAPVFVRR